MTNTTTKTAALAIAITALATTAAQAGTTAPETVKEFFDALKQNKIEQAFNLTNATFRKYTPQAAFGPWVKRNSLNKTVDLTVKKRMRAVDNNVYGENVYISLKRDGLKTLPLTISVMPKGKKWLVMGVFTTKAKKASATTPKSKVVAKRFAVEKRIPTLAKMTSMVNASILDFATSVNAKDMRYFHSTVSKALANKFTPAAFDKTFQKFYQLKGNLLAAQNTPFVFTQKPAAAQLGGVLVKGKWETRPSRIIFAARYIVEGGEWKLAAINVEVKPIKAPQS